MTEPSQSLAGQVALVTGSTRGLGRTIAELLLRAGATVIVSGRAAGDVARAVTELRDLGTVDGIAADLANPDEAHRLGSAAVERFGRVDILVNNAGMSTRGRSWEVSDADWEEQLNVNLRAPFILTQHVVRDLLRRAAPGRIVNISTVGAQAVHRDAAAYDAAKGGLEALTRQLAVELASSGITVNAVAPGSIVERPGAEADRALIPQIQPNIPVGRVGTSADVAAAVAFFCRPDAAFITGQVLTVDGAQSLYLPDGRGFGRP